MKTAILIACLFIAGLASAQAPVLYADAGISVNPLSSSAPGAFIDVGYRTKINISIEANYIFIGQHAIGGSIGYSFRQRHAWCGPRTGSASWRAYAGYGINTSKEATYTKEEISIRPMFYAGAKGCIQFITFGASYAYSREEGLIILTLGAAIIDIIHYIKN